MPVTVAAGADHDLTKFPNLRLATNPITVVHSSGTIIFATLSLGQDLPQTRIEELPKRAAAEAGLDEPFVQVIALGDFSVTCKVASWLKEIKQLPTARSNLRKTDTDAASGGRQQAPLKAEEGVPDRGRFR